jgi:hypothetical protein
MKKFPSGIEALGSVCRPGDVKISHRFIEFWNHTVLDIGSAWYFANSLYESSLVTAVRKGSRFFAAAVRWSTGEDTRGAGVGLAPPNGPTKVYH